MDARNQLIFEKSYKIFSLGDDIDDYYYDYCVFLNVNR